MLDQIIPHLSPAKVIFGLVAVVILRYITISVLQSRRIASLGSRASVRRSYLPLGLDFVYEAIQSSKRHEQLEFWQNAMQSYAHPNNPYTVEANPGGQRIIFTVDPENIKAILATQFTDYGKGERFNYDWHDFLGDSIFTTDGQKWHDSRQLIRPQFVKDRVSDLDIFEEHVQVLMQQLGGQGQTVDASDLFFKYTLDAATHFLLGNGVGSLTSGKSDFAHAFNEVQSIQSDIARAGPLNWLIPRKQFYRQLKVINEFINPYIDQTLEIPSDQLDKKTSTDSYTFLHAIGGYTRDRTILRDQIIAILLAGRDTTACTLTWLFLHLSRSARITKKLRQEIIDTVGLDRAPTYDDLKSMKYLQHVMNETLRLYPVVPFNVRLALKDTTLPTGGGHDGFQPIGVLKGTPIGYSTLSMQRRPDLYPSPASGFPPVEEFVPERWDKWTPKSWTYIPFNGGPRICIGQQFALTEMAYTITRMFQRFAIVEDRMGGKIPQMKSDIVLQPAEGIQVAFFEDCGSRKS